MRRIVPGLIAIAAVLGVAVGVPPAQAAIKIRKPVLERDQETAAPAPARGSKVGRTYFVGEVIFSRGNQVVAEIPEGARERERLIVFDAGLRRRAKAMVLKPLEEGVFLLQTMASYSAQPGDRLALETELEAAVRVLRAGRAAGYREFLELFPRSEHRPRMGRELFRLAMKQEYPTFPGTVIEGRIRLAESVGRQLSLGQVLVVLDRFVIARTDEEGRFRIEGIPRLDESVELKLRVKDEKFVAAEAVAVRIGANAFEEAAVEVPLHVTPTVLAGRVLDDHGAPLPGVEVWTAPYTMEVLTDETGSYRIARVKQLDSPGGPGAVDQPLFGEDYEVFAHRKGYSVNRVVVAAESFQENRVPPINLVRQDPRRQGIPRLQIDLAAYLEIDAGAVSGEGVDPKLNP